MLTIVLAAAALASPGVAWAADPGPVDCVLTSTVHWDGGAGTSTWTDAANWSGDIVPGAGDSVCIPEGANGGLGVVFDAPSQMQQFSSLTTNVGVQVQGGTLQMTDLQVANGAWVNATSRYDAGNIRIANSAYVQAGALLETRGYGVIHGNFTLSGAGTMLWSAGGQLGSDAGTLTVAASAILRVKGSVVLPASRTLEVHGTLAMGDTARGEGELPSGSTPAITGGGSIHIATGGTLTHDNGIGQAYVGPNLDNDGEVIERTDWMRIDGTDAAGVSDSGSFDIGAGQSIMIGAGLQRLGGATVEGGGVMYTSCPYNCGSIAIDGQLTIAPGTTFRHGGGSISGTGNVWGGGTLEWQTGDFAGGSQLTIDEGSTLRQTGGVVVSTETQITVAGRYEMTGDFGLSGAGVLRIAETGEFDKTIGPNAGGGNVGFDNDGRVTITAGMLALHGADGVGIEDQGEFHMAEGAVLRVADGHQRLRDAAITGAGSFEVSCPYNCGTLTLGGSLDVGAGATLVLAGGTTHGDELVAGGTGTIKFAGGSFNGGTSSDVLADIDVLVAGGGMLAGALDIAGTTTWTSGHLNMQAGATLDHRGQMHVTGSGNLGGSGTATIRNHAGSSIDKDGSADTFYVTSDFVNAGEVRARQGMIRIDGSSPDDGTRDSGSYVMDEGASISLGNGPTRLFGAVSLAGAGTFDVNCAYYCGTVDLNGDVSIGAGSRLRLLSGGTMTGTGRLIGDGEFVWDDGAMSSPGTLTISADTSMRVLGGSQSIPAGRVLVNEGTIAMGHPVGEGGPTTGNDPFLGGSGLILNTGLIVKQNGGYGELGSSIDNDGTISNEYGTLRLDGTDPLAQTDTGTLHVAAGATSVMGNNNTERWDGMTLSGGGTVTITCPWYCGTVVASGTTSMLDGTKLRLENGGTLTGATSFTGAGELQLAGGAISGNADLHSAVDIRVSGNASTISAGSRLTNAGTMRMGDYPKAPNPDEPGAYLPGTNAAIGGAGLLVNTSTILKDNGVHASLATMVDNEGRIEVASGSLSFDRTMGATELAAGGASGGEYWIAPGATMMPGSNVAVHLDGAKISGGGTFKTYCPWYCANLVLNGQTTLADGSVIRAETSSEVAGTIDLVGDGTFDWAGYDGYPQLGTDGGIVTIGEGITLKTNQARGLDSRTIVNSGTLQLGGNLTGGTLTNTATGTIRRDGSATISTPLRNDGTVDTAGGTLTLASLDSATFDAGHLKTGIWRVPTGSTLALPSPVTRSSATVELAGALPALATLTENTGVLRLQGAASLALASLTNSATVDLAGTSTLAVAGSYSQTTGSTTIGPDATLNATTLVADGPLAINGAVTADVEIRDALSGNGSITGDVTVTDGTVSPGNSPGTLDVDGDLTMDADTLTVMEIEGEAQQLRDLVNVTGTLTVDGTLDLRTGAAFDPAYASSYDLLVAGVLAGTFDSITETPELAGVKFYDVTQGGGKVVADVTETEYPANPTGLDSPTHDASTPSRETQVEVAWTGAGNDAAGSGLAGYVYEFTQSATANPDTIADQNELAASATSVTSPALVDGSWYLHLRSIDAEGNVASAAASMGPFVIDTTVPLITLVSAPQHGSSTTSTSVETDVLVDDPAAIVGCTLDTDVVSCDGTYTDLEQGAHSFVVTATDAAGNVSTATRSWSVDSIAPTFTISGTTGTVASTTASFTTDVSEPGATLLCSLDGAAQAVCPSPLTYTGLAGGAHQLQVSVRDAAGNSSTQQTLAWSVDVTGPTITITSGPAEGSSTESATVSFGFSTEAGATVTCSVDGAAAAACTSPVSVTVSGYRTHTFTVRASDALGNAGAAVTRTWTLAAPPVVVTPPPAGGGDGGGTTPPPPPVVLPTKGSAGIDKFIGDALANVFNGLAGNDWFKGQGGNDKFMGGAGNDTGYGDAGDDTLFGDAGNDKAFGGAGKDKLTGGTGKDKLNGDAGNDTINAHDKKPGDVVNGGAGKDTCIVNKGDVVKACEKVVRK